ncbi:CPSF2 [Cordylochernes scorpioides]|uniref:Cleavage and polyadenylation specificity factor subunit 2 n=1 Tax=Cordylochernes scorpioides TaxID=51811 RepID=A0ABY6KE18_9ARAC|nr:CPSF2 [Cordylochernes scorpioides]
MGEMTSIIKLKVISGGEDESPHCYLLQVDEFHFLLDCGWDENFSPDFIQELKKYIHLLDAVLLSYPDPLHLGALPYLIGKCNLSCPVYATVPIYKMGQMFMYDLFQSRHNSEDFTLFTLDDVDAAFDKLIQLKYSQSVSLTVHVVQAMIIMVGKGQGLTITPLPAGHMIGGTVWRIAKDGEEEIVYAVDFNHKKERHLNGCALETVIKPSVLITDAYNASYNQIRRRVRDEQLMSRFLPNTLLSLSFVVEACNFLQPGISNLVFEKFLQWPSILAKAYPTTNILQTLRGNGNVLICVDTAGRVLELTHMLDQLWRNQDSGLMAYSLALLNNVSFNVVEFAKSQVEWMSDKIMRSFEGARNNPFHFRHINMCHSLGELNRVPDPKVVLASQPDLECGFARDLFIQWCSNPRNRIVLTSRSLPGTLARKLIDNPDLTEIYLQVKQRVRLEGAELEEHLRREAAAKMVINDHPMESDSEDSDDDMKPSHDGTRHDILIKTESKMKGGFFKQTKKSFPMFPYREEKIKWDEYGEIIRPEDFMGLDGVVGMEEEPVKEEPTHQQQVMPLDDGQEVPTKCISTYRRLELQAAIHFIDFEGRSDSESIRKLLSLTQPRRLILVRGPKDSSTSLRDYCQRFVEKVYIPCRGEEIDATTESHIYQIKLTDALVSSLRFSRAGDVELAWVDAEVEMLERPAEVGATLPEGLPQLALQPLTLGQVQPHPTLFINEVKLSDFRQVLVKNDVGAEFSAGALFCNNKIVVRRQFDFALTNVQQTCGNEYSSIFQGQKSSEGYEQISTIMDHFSKGQGLTITPLPAGHMIGGTVWRIAKDGEEEIVYAVDFNHKKERHLNGCALETVIKPSVLITDAYNASYNQIRRRVRDEQLMTNILQTLRGNGNVLICVDTAGRVLELTHMLDQLWRNQDSGLMAYSLALLNNVSFNVVEFAKSQVEWMSDKIMRSFEGARNNPFHFRHINMCHSLGELNRVPDPKVTLMPNLTWSHTGKVVLASQPDLECGFARDLFIQWCSNPRNRIVLTSRSLPGTLARKLIDNPDLTEIYLQVKQRVRLEGAELEEHLRREAAAKMVINDHPMESDSEDSDDDMKPSHDGTRHDILIKTESKMKGGFFKQTKKSFPMFPYREEKIKWDEYGEIIRPEDFMGLDGVVGMEEEPVKEEPTHQQQVMPLDDGQEVPTKCISTYRRLELQAAIHFIDFEGRSDSESIRKLLSLTQPRRLILVRGPKDSSTSLRDYCQRFVEKVYIPCRGEEIDATTESHIYQIKLTDALVSSLRFSRAGDVELAWVDAEVEMLERPAEVGATLPEGLPQLALQPLTLGQVQPHPTLFINEVKLSDFRQVLVKNDVGAEFSAGALFCNNKIVVRRNETGKINLEGCISDDYLKVRDLLYDQYAII